MQTVHNTFGQARTIQEAPAPTAVMAFFLSEPGASGSQAGPATCTQDNLTLQLRVQPQSSDYAQLKDIGYVLSVTRPEHRSRFCIVVKDE